MPKIRAAEILHQAATIIEDRAAQRDQSTGEKSMARTVNAFWEIHGPAILARGHMTETEGWHFMELLKMTRSAYGCYVADDFADKAAYAGLAAEAAEAEYRETKAELEKMASEAAEIMVLHETAAENPVGDVAVVCGDPLKLHPKTIYPAEFLAFSPCGRCKKQDPLSGCVLRLELGNCAAYNGWPHFEERARLCDSCRHWGGVVGDPGCIVGCSYDPREGTCENYVKKTDGC